MVLAVFIQHFVKIKATEELAKCKYVFINHLQFIIKFILSIEMDSNIYLLKNILFVNLKVSEHTR
jgi:hypothetical protein